MYIILYMYFTSCKVTRNNLTTLLVKKVLSCRLQPQEILNSQTNTSKYQANKCGQKRFQQWQISLLPIEYHFIIASKLKLSKKMDKNRTRPKILPDFHGFTTLRCSLHATSKNFRISVYFRPFHNGSQCKLHHIAHL